ncbi:bifunctional 2-polyprenyl-6-hydroxyphenol methylase/3-demethylubiquinol 3-O-methyltransferase UbiG [Polymorphobacter fuscus]|uniref:Ubiquinone biosynthesis O-methyltransferase n=2 Tax=Sandarakinorhabdus fusca TaxID=1439888 RepID=A0A7C9GYX1_9SPHN|nr:bifunctional 2-polyprenyl-6-hydroxyphenol methylase/3-demethylubiquinol 3-O-methyltransferase UbiG [Polymorphobacter fuscus]MQT18194.1 bifunctional 2-polyprenyl-6-hydroxyphenol methylase/3-demethylubiquinol 3-O-methyltransferase UbiG [Polymorphobacter fuscus]
MATQAQTDITAPSINAGEAEFFGRLAADWWNPNGSSAMLHRITLLRSALVRDTAAAHFGRGIGSRRPLVGLRALDIGCGAGLMTEPLARMGAVATGIDAAPENIAAASAHAAAGGLSIDYRAVSVEALAATGGVYDIITCFEVVEHVADRDSFFASLAMLLAPGGVAILSTPNRTAASWAVLIAGAEIITRTIPRGAHDWQRFMTPPELSEALVNAGLSVTATRGLGWSPARGFVVGDDVAINYFLVASRAG